MPRLTPDRQRDRREQIAEAALRCFARAGVAGTSMADISTESGLSAGSIYSHFDGKSALLRYTVTEVLQARLTDLGDRLGAHEGALGPAEVLDELLQIQLPYPREAGAVLLQVWGQVSLDAELGSVAADAMAQLRAAIAQALQPWAHGQPGDPQATADQYTDVIIAMVHGFAVRTVLTPGLDPQALRRALVASLPSAQR